MEDVEKKWRIWKREIKSTNGPVGSTADIVSISRLSKEQLNYGAKFDNTVRSYWISFFSFPLQRRCRVGVSLGKCHVVPRTKQTEGQVTYMNYFFLRLLLGSKKSQTLRKQMGLLL
jgi:hypothetical protein